MNIESVAGKELDLMLKGKKPMAAFYRATSELFDVIAGQNFSEQVKTGNMFRSVFYVKNECQEFRLIYVVFTLPSERWRAGVYKALKKAGQHEWNAAMEGIEQKLLFY